MTIEEKASKMEEESQETELGTDSNEFFNNLDRDLNFGEIIPMQDAVEVTQRTTDHESTIVALNPEHLRADRVNTSLNNLFYFISPLSCASVLAEFFF
jgi:hypothetical protein